MRMAFEASSRAHRLSIALDGAETLALGRAEQGSRRR